MKQIMISIAILLVSGCMTKERPQVQVNTRLIFEAVADANKDLELRVQKLEAESALLKSSPRYKADQELEDVERHTPVCQVGTVSTWDDAKKEFYCLMESRR